MLKKIGNSLFENVGLKLVALGAAFILWLVVVNINDPNVTKTFSCSVTIENEDYLEEQGYTYEIVDGSTVYFSVTAKRSIIGNLSNSDFKATADMQSVENLSQIPIDVTATRYSSQVEITKRTQYVEITVEELMTSQYIITTQQSGEPADGYVVSSLSASPNVLKVSGPASVVEQISKVVAIVSVDNISTDISDSVIPTLYDEDGNTIDTSKLSMNLDSVTVSVSVQNEKTITLEAETTGTPADGYYLMDITFDPEEIEVMGEAVNLNTLSSIVIPADVLDIDGATEDVVAEVDISAYLPDGVTLVDSSQKNVTVTAKIEQASTMTVELPTSNLTIVDTPMNSTASFVSDTVSVVIIGLDADLSALDTSSITGTVSAAGLSAGTHNVEVELDLDEGTYSYQYATTSIYIQETTASTSTTTSGSTTLDSGTSTDSTSDTTE